MTSIDQKQTASFQSIISNVLSGLTSWLKPSVPMQQSQPLIIFIQNNNLHLNLPSTACDQVGSRQSDQAGLVETNTMPPISSPKPTP